MLSSCSLAVVLVTKNRDIFRHLALFSYDKFGIAAIICAVRKTAAISVLAMTVIFDMLSNMTAIMSRIGPASPT